ncbi:hypothetical protein PNOK_0721800 [Pyrrhoderma noxium]|uniref:Uncharacterized protein n=1 Tax=Pyrrhoderma noxium TaxID=2282107 RepID=A0A286UCA7_9AGAM|nr:hypothetical protein PNOK_0721800 [Pyrrhoderma noxium]
MKSIITAKSAIGISTRGRTVIARPESPPLNLELVAQHSQLLLSVLPPYVYKITFVFLFYILYICNSIGLSV